MENFFTSGFFILLGIIIGVITTILIQHKVGRFIFYNEYDDYDDDPEEEEEPTVKPEKLRELVYHVKDPKDIEKVIKNIFSAINSKPNFDVEQFEKLVDKDFFKRELQKNMNDHNEKQEYEYSAYFRDKIEDMDNWFDERKKFFVNNIGNRVIPDRTNCDCENCKTISKEGVVIENKDHALQLFSNELNGILIRSVIIYNLM